jgi:hypothetical protein
MNEKWFTAVATNLSASVYKMSAIWLDRARAVPERRSFNLNEV